MKIKKRLNRAIRYHWATERLRYWLRGCPTLILPEIDLKLEIRSEDVLIDCGANVGQITSRFARTGAVVYAFEPNPVCYSVLSYRFKAMPNVQCFHRGVMDQDCTLTLSTPQAYGKWDALDTTVAASFTANSMHLDEYSVVQVEVQCIDLAQFILEKRKRIRFLKLDIEGSEILVLNRMIDSGAIDFVDHIAVETHEAPIPHFCPKQMPCVGAYKPRGFLRRLDLKDARAALVTLQSRLGPSPIEPQFCGRSCELLSTAQHEATLGPTVPPDST